MLPRDKLVPEKRGHSTFPGFSSLLRKGDILLFRARGSSSRYPGADAEKLSVPVPHV